MCVAFDLLEEAWAGGVDTQPSWWPLAGQAHFVKTADR